MLRILPALLLAAVPLGAAAAEDMTGFTLPNGLQVVVIEDHRAPAVTQMIWYKVGAADEVPGKSGLAHMLEHLMFKGTDTLAPGEFSATVAANGGTDNAFTSWDYTAYFQRVAADRLPLMMQMEADRMTHLVLTPEVVAPERAVVLEERAQRTETSPDALMQEQMRAAQFLNSPYGRPVIGWRREVEQLSAEDALEFYRAHYAPNNAVLVVAGDVAPERVRALAEREYGPIPANPAIPAVRLRPQEPPQSAARRLVFEDARVAQPYISRSYLAPDRRPGDQKTAAALTLLADLLGGDAATSYLGGKLQFDHPTALYTGAGYGGTALDPTTFTLVVMPSEGVSLGEAETALDAALKDFLARPVDAARLDALKRQFRAAEIYRQDSARSRAQMVGAALTTGLTLDDVRAWPEVVQQVTGDDILAAARTVLDPKQSVTAFVRPPAGAALAAGRPAAPPMLSPEVSQ